MFWWCEVKLDLVKLFRHDFHIVNQKNLWFTCYVLGSSLNLVSSKDIDTKIQTMVEGPETKKGRRVIVTPQFSLKDGDTKNVD